MRVAGIPLGVLSISQPPLLLSNVKAWLTFDGTNGSAVFTDSSPDNRQYLQNVGDEVISTTDSKFGGSSLYIPTSIINGVYLNNSNLPTITDKFTMLFWYKRPTTVTRRGLMALMTSGYVNPMCGVYVENDQVKLVVRKSGNVEETLIHQNAPSLTTFNYVAVVRDENKDIYLYLNGVKSSAKLTSITFSLGVEMLWFGRFNVDAGSVTGTGGYIDDAVLIYDTALYSGDFTPPTAPFSAT